MELQRLNQGFMVASKLSHQNVNREVRRITNDHNGERIAEFVLDPGNPSRSVDDAPATSRDARRGGQNISGGPRGLATIIIRLVRGSSLIRSARAPALPTTASSSFL
jgi:hypothetical protein